MCYLFSPRLRRLFALALTVAALQPTFAQRSTTSRPNILFVISDDQSYPHTSAYGYKAVSTPAFDRIAKEGALFRNATVASPGCSPSRAAILTGRNCWQLEEAGTHGSYFPTKYVTYVDRLADAGYAVGFTGKGWGPGDWKGSGRKHNPAGPEWSQIKFDKRPQGVSPVDYAANFEKFLSQRKDGQPFCFWLGSTEPHRVFDSGSGERAGKRPADVQVPGFLPDRPTVRTDILDYCLEIEWFDKQLASALKLLEEKGELDNTLVIVTSDNGMAFPRAKANTYEYGIHVPLAMRWPSRIKAGTKAKGVASLVDIAPTILQAAGVAVNKSGDAASVMEGKSLLPFFATGKVVRTEAYSSRERHSSSRWNNLSYPQRCIRTDRYLYIQNLKPDRWPAGDPQEVKKNEATGAAETAPMHQAYYDIDAGPSLALLQNAVDDTALLRYRELSIAKRPAEELYDIVADPYCLKNLAGSTAHKAGQALLRKKLEDYGKKTGDPRYTGNGEVFEGYPRREGIQRAFPAPAK